MSAAPPVPPQTAYPRLRPDAPLAFCHDAENDDAALGKELNTIFGKVVTARVMVRSKEGGVLTARKNASFESVSGLPAADVTFHAGDSEAPPSCEAFKACTQAVVSAPTCGFLDANPQLRTVYFVPGAYNGQRSVDEVQRFLARDGAALVMADRTSLFQGRGPATIQEALQVAGLGPTAGQDKAPDAYAAALATTRAMGWANVRLDYIFEQGPYAGDDREALLALWDAADACDARKAAYLAALAAKAPAWTVKPKKRELTRASYYASDTVNGPYGDLAMIAALEWGTARCDRGDLVITERGRARYYGVKGNPAGRVYVPRICEEDTVAAVGVSVEWLAEA